MVGLGKISRSLQAKVLFAVISIVLLAFASIGAYNVLTQYSQWSEGTKRTGFLLADTIYAAIKHPMATGSEETVEQQLLDVAKRFDGIEVYIFDFQKKVTYATLKESLRKQLTDFVANRDIMDGMTTLLASGNTSQKAFEEQVNGKPYLAVLTPIVNEEACFHCHGNSKKVLGGMLVRQSTEESVASLERARNLNIVVGVLGALVISGLLSWLISCLVTKPVTGMVDTVRVFAEGDITLRLKNTGKDELGVLSESFNQMSDRFCETIELASSTANAMAEGTTQQAASIEETSASLEQMAAMARSNAQQADEAKLLIDGNAEALTEANRVMKKSIESLDEIVSSSHETAKIIKDIDEIAFQTNLLALNAAVEAARAGEAGLSFAVVAEEVRNLAQRTAEAAKSTGELIKSSANKAKQGRELILETDAAYREVALQAGKVREVVAEIDNASKEQSQGAEQINQAMAEIEKVVLFNKSAAEKLSEALSYFRTSNGGHTTRAKLPVKNVDGKEFGFYEDKRSIHLPTNNPHEDDLKSVD